MEALPNPLFHNLSDFVTDIFFITLQRPYKLTLMHEDQNNMNGLVTSTCIYIIIYLIFLSIIFVVQN